MFEMWKQCPKQPPSTTALTVAFNPLNRNSVLSVFVLLIVYPSFHYILILTKKRKRACNNDWTFVVCVSHFVHSCQFTRHESDETRCHSEISFHRLVVYFPALLLFLQQNLKCCISSRHPEDVPRWGRIVNIKQPIDL